ncbi:hypothetical protein IB642_01300 [Allofrancisella guangzhouensis]|uniref:Uncharacterized protein n=1 Tax=Allofrancisella guangzhouensis TaxID=594679 RepID=A0A0A8E640_9GAMM|nr:hypothetical protein [Allofrancisella guangzhouensis]AJC49439.1 hypothetical protein SD28_07315 [Allofrancisella guangzhouensis]MBK2026730.1 hypothetical protein [Allofrancisella guangzhouensis]MBK2043655.1 hypothetical protein [Allofrancisella guangzhouensis]MBK2046190.1 hypothetical protein [Allofrancisella guangzhouensis]
MKKIAKIVVLVGFVTLLQDCSMNQVENDFSYESLSDTVEGSPFRNRKLDYARVEVVEKPSLKIPAGLNGELIEPKFALPDGENTFAKSQIEEAEKGMLPPNYDDKFDMSKIVADQISRISISVVYDDKGALKLVFREPLPVTINLLEDYFKSHSEPYEISSSEDKVLSGHIITVKDNTQNLVFIIKIRKIDELSSLVTVPAVFNADGKTLADNYVDQEVGLLNQVRKALNNQLLKSQDNINLAKAAQVSVTSNSLKPTSLTESSNSKSSLGGLAGAISSIGFGSYDRTIQKSKQEDTNNVENQDDYINMTAPSGSQVYNSDATPQVLST